MKRDIRLYIGGELADLNSNELIQFNYTMEELSNPTIVKNSYSQQITLLGTDNNNRIFGSMFRLDRITAVGGGVGAQYNPMNKVPFEIYADAELLESGYVKLDGISREGDKVTYSVSLFGGLGEFFYSLSYDDAGEKKTLASLNYINGNASELSFTINRNAVLEAWSSLGTTPRKAKWDVINFMPAYNGIPTGTFSADKAIINPANIGLPTLVTSDNKQYTPFNGYSLVNLSEKHTEWEVKDLRSYLQRPVLRMKSFLTAIQNPNTNGGFAVEYDNTFFNDDNPYYSDTWLTLPILNNINLNQVSGTYTLTLDSGFDSDISLWFGNSTQTGGGSVEADATLAFGCEVDTPISSTISLYLGRVIGGVEYRNAIFVQMVGYDENNNAVCGSPVISLQSSLAGASVNYYSTEFLAGLVNYIPAIESGYEDVQPGFFNVNTSGVGTWNRNITLEMEGQNVKSIDLRVTPVNIGGNELFLFDNNDNLYDLYGYTVKANSATATYESFINARSGASVSKAELLNTEKTPADYLLGYCKMFGLNFIYDKMNRKVQIVTRNTLYNNNVVDLSKRIDYSQTMQITPFTFDSKWYDFKLANNLSEFAKYYTNTRNKTYGAQRVNTGYNFNASAKDVLSGNALNGGTEVRERGKYFNNVTEGGYPIPSVFLNAENKYTLYDAFGGTLEVDIPTPTNDATITYYDDVYKSYDNFSKMQFHDVENKAYEERDTLVFFRGFSQLDADSRFTLTDDTWQMNELNDGVPCWYLNAWQDDAMYRITQLPMFGRYLYSGNNIVTALDMGVPEEIDIPSVTYNNNATIYTKGWQSYIADRYDKDVKVVTAYVNFSGIQVSEKLLRQFYFFDGCIWALNKIINYTLTSDALVQCEFVRVMDKSNYFSQLY